MKVLLLKYAMISIAAMLFLKAFYIPSMGIIWVLLPVWLPIVTIFVLGFMNAIKLVRQENKQD